MDYLVKFIPLTLQVWVINLLLQFYFAGRLSKEERLDSLNGTVIKVYMKDLDTHFLFHVKERSIRCYKEIELDPEVILAGNQTDFLDMFFKKEDADSLFFSRKLIIEGNVEKSVLFKNIIANL